MHVCTKYKYTVNYTSEISSIFSIVVGKENSETKEERQIKIKNKLSKGQDFLFTQVSIRIFLSLDLKHNAIKLIKQNSKTWFETSCIIYILIL